MSKFGQRVRAYYGGVFKDFSRYWAAYGRGRALVSSPYVHVSLFMGVLMNPLWRYVDWSSLVMATTPSILGFSLAGYAVWLALGDDRFKEVLSGKEKSSENSPFMQVSAAFVHFIMLQMLALLSALGFKTFRLAGISGVVYHICSFFGFVVFLYSLLCALAATFAVFRVSLWYETFIRKGR